VDVSARKVSLTARPLVLRTAAAVGAAATPTPTGPLLREQRLNPRRPDRAFGPGAIRDLRLLRCPDRVDAGRPDRDPRDERAVVDRQAVSNGCIRVANPGYGACSQLRWRDACHHPRVRRRLLVAAALLVLRGAGAIAWAVTRPDPHTQALADGCARSRQAEFLARGSGWAYVRRP